MRKFSIVIPTYNRAQKLVRAINSVFELDYNKNNIELLVIDDGSTDETSKILMPFTQNPEFHYHRLEVNCGVGYARNFGIRKAKNEWVILLDSDNLLKPNALSVNDESSDSLHI